MILPAPLVAAPEDVKGFPNAPAVFLVHAREGSPYLGRTTMLRRRMLRLFGQRPAFSRLLNLRSVAVRIESWLTASQIESMLIHYALARRHFPEDYLKLTRLRMPPYLRVILSNEFPRMQVTTQVSGSRSFTYGPFRARATAEAFESQVLDLFQMRRCQEDLEPALDHPGCIYGEMNMCLRPCQQVVSAQEYASEVRRATDFLASQGRSLIETITAARERFSAEMEFEEAARQHKLVEKIEQALKLRDELAMAVDRLNGVTVARSMEAQCVELWFVLAGCWLPPVRFSLAVVEGRPQPLDQRLRSVANALVPPKISVRERQEHLAILARWYYSSWREGEWLPFQSVDAIPYRKLVNAIHRVAAGSAQQ